MPKAHITSKWQVTIPKAVRDQLGLRPGDRIDFVAVPGGFRIEKHLTESPFSKYRGCLRVLGGQDPDLLLDDMRGM